MQLIDTEARHADLRRHAARQSRSPAARRPTRAAGVAAFGAGRASWARSPTTSSARSSATTSAPPGWSSTSAPAAGPEADRGTARCLILVTPDAQRTMNTYLGVAALLEPGDVDGRAHRPARPSSTARATSGTSPSPRPPSRKAMDAAHDAGTPVSFTLSDGFCVDRHRAEFLDLVEHRIDILFANEDEICSLYEVDDFEEAARRVQGHCAIACLTRSEKGSVILTAEGERIDVPAAPTEVVDTTGAGDLYAAGLPLRLGPGRRPRDRRPDGRRGRRRGDLPPRRPSPGRPGRAPGGPARELELLRGRGRRQGRPRAPVAARRAQHDDPGVLERAARASSASSTPAATRGRSCSPPPAGTSAPAWTSACSARRRRPRWRRRRRDRAGRGPSCARPR